MVAKVLVLVLVLVIVILVLVRVTMVVVLWQARRSVVVTSQGPKDKDKGSDQNHLPHCMI